MTQTALDELASEMKIWWDHGSGIAFRQDAIDWFVQQIPPFAFNKILQDPRFIKYCQNQDERAFHDKVNNAKPGDWIKVPAHWTDGVGVSLGGLESYRLDLTSVEKEWNTLSDEAQERMRQIDRATGPRLQTWQEDH